MTDSLISGGNLKFCSKCGQQMRGDAKACPGCGQKQESNKVLIICVIVAVAILCVFGFFAIIGILAAVSIPNFVGAQQKAKEASVKANMRTMQIAVETYGVDHNGHYPTAVDNEIKSYFPNGSSGSKPLKAGIAPLNPFSNEREWPVSGNVTDVNAARNNREGTLPEGAVEYSVIYSGNHEACSYAIRGGGKLGHLIQNSKKNGALVLSNN